MLKHMSNIWRWIDSEYQGHGAQQGAGAAAEQTASTEFNVLRLLPFIAMHLVCLGVLWVGFSWFALAVCLALFWGRMFAITAFYHRYFAHRSFKTNRFWQFMFAVAGNSAAQRGPLWWASHHRKHHQYSDQEEDLHSPVHRGFWWSHVGWFSCDASFATPYRRIKDFAKYPELRLLNRYDSVVPILLGVSLYGLGSWLETAIPTLETSGAQLLIWGFFISTVLLFHSTVTINSLGHLWGNKRFPTKDESRNNGFLALVTLGEGWHNNHHRWAASTRQGFYWWEIDITYYILVVMSWLGIVSDLRPVPAHILEEGRRFDAGQRHK